MKKSGLFLFIMLLTVGASQAEKREPYSGSRIFWDMSSEVTVFDQGNYARMIELQDGRLLAVSEGSGGIQVSYSQNKGKSWSSPERIVASPSKVFYAVPDVIQLSDGTIIVGFNPRPQEPYSDDRLFGIRTMRSTDNGETWGEVTFVYDAKSTFNDGCWEPSFLELPSGEVQCYFANEGEYTASSEQCISMCRSSDKGQSWSEPVKVCFRAGSRDGMPVPVLLQNGEIAVIIEDNGWPGRGNFAATTVRTTIEDNWKSGYVDADSPKRNMIFETIPPVGEVSAAPYIRMLPWGETIASFQGNKGRNGVTDLQYFDMFVYVGDENAKNFKAGSTPFALGLDQHSIWNSVSVIEDSVVVAVGSIGNPNKNNHVNIIKGYPKRRAVAAYCNSIAVDAQKGSNENWYTKNADQLMMGHNTGNRTTADFAYDEEYLYFTTRVIDRNITNTGIDNDGVQLYIDADNVSDTEPVKGMYSFFFDTDGTIDFRRADGGRWVADENTADIKYALSLKSMYYDIEVAIPWELLGKSKAPVGQRMAMALEIVNKEEYVRERETIPDVDTDASWTWLEFLLLPGDGSGVTGNEAAATAADVTVAVGDGSMSVIGSAEMSRVSVYAFDGRLMADVACNSATQEILLPAEAGGGILKVVFKNGMIVAKKLIF